MKIAIDISPLQTGHKVRGVGFYLEHLKNALLASPSDNNYTFFTQRKDVSKNVDIIHYPYFDPFFLTLPVKKYSPTVVTVHDLIPLVFPEHFPSGMKGKLKWYRQRFALKNSNAIITDSHASKKDIMKYTGIQEGMIHVVYLAAGEAFQQLHGSEYRTQLLTKYNLPPKFVLYVGDATWNKNLPRLIEAIQELNITLVMVGKTLAEKCSDPSNPWNKNLVKVQEIAAQDKRIIRLGFLPMHDLVALYNFATVTVVPSLYEGFGLPVLEAMSSGCPVVTTKRGSLLEVAGDAALYVDPEDSKSIANGIGEVFFHKSLQEELRKKGLDQAKKFSWKKTAKDTIAVYEKVIAER